MLCFLEVADSIFVQHSLAKLILLRLLFYEELAVIDLKNENLILDVIN